VFDLEPLCRALEKVYLPGENEMTELDRYDGQTGTTIESDLLYAVHDGTPLTGTLYRPSAGKLSRVIVAVHGGGWKTGSPDRYKHWGLWLSKKGFALFAIKYRLADRPENSFPAALIDVMAAVRFIQAKSQQFGIDPDRVALMGDSAGGHLGSLAALAGHSAYTTDHIEDSDFRVRAVVSIYGVYDLLSQWEHDQIARPRDHVTEPLMGMSPLEDKLAYFRASPIAYTNTKAPRVSFLVAWGTHDDVVDPCTQSERFVKELKQSGQFVRTVPIVGAPHFWIDQPIEGEASFTAFLAPKLFRFLNDRV
jgi:acetyl esterase/lipase